MSAGQTAGLIMIYPKWAGKPAAVLVFRRI